MHRRTFLASLIGALAARTTGAAPPRATRALRWEDFPTPLQRRLDALGVGDWNAWAASVRADTRRRLDEGRDDHLVAVALQSRRFTTQDRIEPALSARAFVREARVPADAARRLDALALALATGDHRLGVVLSLRDGLPRDRHAIRAALDGAYARTMTFLYEKEFGTPTADAVARLFAGRGLSSDTGVDAGYAIAEGIGAMPRTAPVARVLIVGPGLEFGPRTSLDDDLLGQCLQPCAVLDALRATGRATGDVTVDVLDVSARVLAALEALPAGTPTLRLQSSLSSRTHRLLPGYVDYLRAWGAALGLPATPLVQRPDGRLRREVPLHAGAWPRGEAWLGNVATDVPDATYDLVVATNVLAYLPDAALCAALGGVAQALRPGGVLLHNDSRDIVALAGPEAGLPVVQARTIAFTSAEGGRRAAAWDWLAIHRRGEPWR